MYVQRFIGRVQWLRSQKRYTVVDNTVECGSLYGVIPIEICESVGVMFRFRPSLTLLAPRVNEKATI